MRHAAAFVFTSLITIVAGGCQSEQMDGGSGIVDPDVPPSYADDIQPIFTASCGGSACHIGGTTNGVNLTTHAQVIASRGAQYRRLVVTPLDADGSALVDKISGSPDFGVRMPSSRAALSGTQIGLIRAWIDDGAKNN